MTVPQEFIDDMAEAGVSLSSPWDLVNGPSNYRAAVPALIRWLDRAQTEVPAAERIRFQEAIVRSLGTKTARGVAAPALIRELHRSGVPWDYTWAVANSLEVVADESVADDLLSAVGDKRFGPARGMLVLALARTKDPRAVDTLIDLLEDEAVAGQAVMALGRLRAGEAREAIERCLGHPKAWVRREAKKTLARLV